MLFPDPRDFSVANKVSFKNPSTQRLKRNKNKSVLATLVFPCFLPIPNIDACTRYLLDIMHCVFFERTTRPKKTDPIDMEMPRKVWSWTAEDSPRPSSRERGICKEDQRVTWEGIGSKEGLFNGVDSLAEFAC
jgi:hypothetical protein